MVIREKYHNLRLENKCNIEFDIKSIITTIVRTFMNEFTNRTSQYILYSKYFPNNKQK